MLCGVSMLQRMPVDTSCDFEKGYSYIYNAVSGTEIKPGGCSSQISVSISVTLLFGIGNYEFLSGFGFA